MGGGGSGGRGGAGCDEQGELKQNLNQCSVDLSASSRVDRALDNAPWSTSGNYRVGYHPLFFRHPFQHCHSGAQRYSI